MCQISRARKRCGSFPAYEHVVPSLGFNSIQEEVDALQSQIEPLPAVLQEKPRFIFNPFKACNSNQSLFHALQKAQKRCKTLLRADHRTEKVLEIIGGQKPRIDCEKTALQRSLFSIVDNFSKDWSCIIKGASSRFNEPGDKQAFMQAFKEPVSSPVPPPMIAASREMLRGLQQARDNLAAAESRCRALSNDKSVQTEVPNQLYVKIEEHGVGEAIEGINRLRLKYVIEDHSGNILFAHHDTWIHLADSILGFQHGLQGMRIGEKRTLFIHPALGYGALTTVPPCSLLIAHVQLLDADLSSKVTFPPIRPLTFDWVEDHRFSDLIEQSLVLLPQYVGAFYGNLLKELLVVAQKHAHM